VITPATLAGSAYATAKLVIVSCAFSQLGLGNTQIRAPDGSAACSPSLAFGTAKATRYAVMPAIATTTG